MTFTRNVKVLFSFRVATSYRTLCRKYFYYTLWSKRRSSDCIYQTWIYKSVISFPIISFEVIFVKAKVTDQKYVYIFILNRTSRGIEKLYMVLNLKRNLDIYYAQRILLDMEQESLKTN